MAWPKKTNLQTYKLLSVKFLGHKMCEKKMTNSGMIENVKEMTKLGQICKKFGGVVVSVRNTPSSGLE